MYTFKPNPIICPIDFSELSSLALKYAAVGAREFNAQLIVCHSELLEIPRYITKNVDNALINQLKNAKNSIITEVQNHSEKILDSLAMSLQIKYMVFDIHPVEAILKLAEKESAGLIVMGTHGYRGIKRFLLGSVTENIFRTSKIPVFTVRQKENDFIDINQVNAMPEIKRILCPCGLTDTAIPPLQVASYMAQRFHARLSVLYSIEPGQSEDPPEAYKKNICSWIEKNMKIDCDFEPVVRQGNAAEQIISQAKEKKEDLIIIGVDHKPFLKESYIGRTTELVLRQAPVPVLAVPDI